jgi:hypothetical protein
MAMRCQNCSHIIFIAILSLMGWLVGCASGIATPSGVPSVGITETSPAAATVLASTNTPSPTEKPVRTSTFAPSSTQTPSPTQSPTPTETSTLTPSPTPEMVAPGFYYAGGCDSTLINNLMDLEFCVVSVTVERDRRMIFTVSWTMTGIPHGRSVSKRSDSDNRNMYLIDNLGNRYDHIAGGEAAYQRVGMKDGVPITGWFRFEAPPEKATTFSFYDDDNQIVIKGIRLFFPVILYDEWSLVNYPLVLEYLKEDWELTELDNGNSVLTHKWIAGCMLQEYIAVEPQGNFKNRIDIGGIIYEIYGYTDQKNQLGIREYLVVDGLEGVDPGVKPFFIVTIPLDDSLTCIVDTSDVLARLFIKEP